MPLVACFGMTCSAHVRCNQALIDLLQHRRLYPDRIAREHCAHWYFDGHCFASARVALAKKQATRRSKLSPPIAFAPTAMARLAPRICQLIDRAQLAGLAFPVPTLPLESPKQPCARIRLARCTSWHAKSGHRLQFNESSRFSQRPIAAHQQRIGLERCWQLLEMVKNQW